MKPIARLGLGWLLMFTGAALVLESGLAELRVRSRTLAALAALGGFALLVGGAILRRTATQRDHRR
jgi:hypothetical protein